jgi:hypothetical protein
MHINQIQKKNKKIITATGFFLTPASLLPTCTITKQQSCPTSTRGHKLTKPLQLKAANRLEAVNLGVQ